MQANTHIVYPHSMIQISINFSYAPGTSIKSDHHTINRITYSEKVVPYNNNNIEARSCSDCGLQKKGYTQLMHTTSKKNSHKTV